MPGGEFDIKDMDGVQNLGAVNAPEGSAPVQFTHVTFASADQPLEVKTPQTTLDNFLGLG